MGRLFAGHTQAFCYHCSVILRTAAVIYEQCWARLVSTDEGDYFPDGGIVGEIILKC
jgi:hypothetical protein